MDLDGAVWRRVVLGGVLGLGSLPRRVVRFSRGGGGDVSKWLGRSPRASSVVGSLLAVLFLVGSRQNPFSSHLCQATRPAVWVLDCCRRCGRLCAVAAAAGGGGCCCCVLLPLAVYYYVPLPSGALPALHQPYMLGAREAATTFRGLNLGGPMRCYGYIPLSARHGGSHPDAQVGKVDLAPRGHRRQPAILTALQEEPALAPDSQRSAMPAACSRHRPAALCPESVVTQYAPLLVCALVRLTSCAGHRRAGRENGRVLRTCSQTLPTIFPTPALPDLLAHAAALLPRHAFVH